MLRILLIAGVAALAMALGTSAFAQGVTTSSLNGFVTEKSGRPIGGATITVVHEPSGTRATTVTRPNGHYDLSGLRVGGPYTVSVEAKDVQPQSQKDIYLNLDEAQSVSFVLSTEVVVLEAMHVTTERDTTFDIGKMSTNTTFNSQEITFVPVVRRDVQEVANLDSRIGLAENTTQVEWGLSAQGQNSRFNSFLVDGVQANDPFGLNANGFGSLRSPVPLDFIEALSIDLSPYDVTRTGFTGALINAVVKSGTNDFHGGFAGFYTGKSLRAKNPLNLQHDQLQERTQEAWLGGPIIRNKLFFFLGWQDFKRITAAPSQIFAPDPSVVDQIVTAAKSFNYDPGTLGASNSVAKQKTYLAKIDWNITDKQRATFTYRRTDSSTPNFADFNFTTATSLSNHWYQAHRIDDTFTLQLNSQWTPDFRTDAAAQYRKYNGTAAPNGAPFPEIYINGVPGTRLDNGAAVTNGQLDIGTNYSYQLNNLFTKEYNGHLYGEYAWGSHTFKFGGDTDKNQYDDKFVQYYYGRYAFGSVADFAAGLANYLQYQQATAGFTLPQGYAYYSMTDFGLLAEDTWKPSQNLTVMGGLRFDYPWFPGKPPYNGAFAGAFGFRNNTTASGNYTIEPRFGASYELPDCVLPGVLGGRKTQIRGGVGLFLGTNPAVWVANSYQTAGVLNTVLTSSAGNPNRITTSTAAGSIVFNSNPTYVQTLPPPAVPTATINVTDPDFRVPTSWKANIGIDHTLPWWGLVATAEANFIRVKEGLDYRDLNLKAIGTLPDGRNLYNYNSATTGRVASNFAHVLELTNTDKGGSQSYTLGVRRPMSKHWSFSVSFTHTHATEVQALTSSVATSNFNYRSTINPNAGAEVNSQYATPNKLVVAATRELNFFKRDDALTTVTAVLRIQTGHAYSWVFGNDVNGDGTTGNDAFYVPIVNDSLTADPKVTWGTTTIGSTTVSAQDTHDAFLQFLNGTDLVKRMGSIVKPNTSYNPEQQTLDLHIEQQIPMPKLNQIRLSLYLDCLNFANLLNDRWGAITGLDFGTGFNGYNRNPGVTATYSATTGKYTYSFNPSSASAQPFFTNASRWQLQIGAKLQF